MESDTESVDSWDEEALGLEECLFCSDIAKSLEENVTHMTNVHSFFIPDIEYLTDLEGLITYLGEKVGVGKICLWCNGVGKSFHTTKSVQQHMTDKGHCKILHEGETLLEFADFYDYRSSYPDYVEGEDEEMESDNEDDDDDDDDEDNVLNDEGYQLVLPSGATIGHRSLMKYYKQNIPPERALVKASSVHKVMAQYKALGWLGATGVSAEKKRKDMAYLQRWRNKSHMKLGLKQNKFQPHFRAQVMF